MTQAQEFYQFVSEVSQASTYKRILSEIQLFGQNNELKAHDLPVFYMELCVSLKIMYVPSADEKRETIAKCNGNIPLAKQTILFNFIKNNF